MFMKFQLVTNDRETVMLALSEIVSIRQFEDRKSREGNFAADVELSEIVMKNGTKFRVYGHVEQEVRNAYDSVGAGV